MSKGPRRYFLREKEVRQLFLDFSQKFRVNTAQLFGSKPSVELVEAQAVDIFIINGRPLLARFGGVLLPTLFFDEFLSSLPKIVVDMGAVPYVCGGADVMAPGVVRIQGDFDKSDQLLIVDERHGKSLAIGVALFNSQAMKSIKRGKIVKNIHYVGDRLWDSIKRLA